MMLGPLLALQLALLPMAAPAAAAAVGGGGSSGRAGSSGSNDNSVATTTDGVLPTTTIIGSAAELQLGFDSGNGSLVHLISLGREFLAAPTPVWQLTATDCESVFPAGSAVDSLSHGAGHHARAIISGDPEVLILRWDNISVPTGHAVDVEVRVVIERQHPSKSKWLGSVSSPAGCCIQSFSLVDLRTLRWDHQVDKMFLPVIAGTMGGQPLASRFDFPEKQGASQERSEQFDLWATNGFDRTMGWMALLAAPHSAHDTPQALYVGAHDPHGRLKMMPASGGPAGTALLRVLHVPDTLDSRQPSNWTVPPTMLAVVNGSWCEASQIYREWAINNALWTRKGTIRQRQAAGRIPDWITRVPFFAQGNFNCTRVPAYGPVKCADEMQRLRMLLGGVELGLHWYQWNTEPFDVGYPQWTSRSYVANEVHKAQDNGVHVFPYTNGRLFDPTLPAWNVTSVAKHACGCYKGKLVNNPPNVSGSGQIPCAVDGTPGYYAEKYENNDKYMHGAGFAVMDPADPFWANTLASECKRLITANGFHGYYVDQVAASNPAPCFQAHRRGREAGSSWSDGNRAVLSALQAAGDAAAHQPSGLPVALMSESINEQYIGELSFNLAIYDYQGAIHCTQVPAYQAVYGGFTLNVGDNRYPGPWREIHDNIDESWVGQQRAMLAQQFVGGHVMGWMLLQELAHWMNNASFAEDMAYIAQLAQLRLNASEYLVHGRLWRPPTLVLSQDNGTAVEKLSLCDWRAVVSTDGPPLWKCCNVTMVVGHAWLSQNRSLALVLANHGLQAVRVAANLGASPPRGSTYLRNVRLPPTGARLFGDGRVEAMLQGRSAEVIVVALSKTNAWQLKSDDESTVFAAKSVRLCTGNPFSPHWATHVPGIFNQSKLDEYLRATMVRKDVVDIVSPMIFHIADPANTTAQSLYGGLLLDANSPIIVKALQAHGFRVEPIVGCPGRSPGNPLGGCRIEWFRHYFENARFEAACASVAQRLSLDGIQFDFESAFEPKTGAWANATDGVRYRAMLTRIKQRLMPSTMVSVYTGDAFLSQTNILNESCADRLVSMTTYGGRRDFDIALPRDLQASGPQRFSLGLCPSCAVLAGNSSAADIRYRFRRAREVGVQHLTYWLLEWEAGQRKPELLLPVWWAQIRAWHKEPEPILWSPATIKGAHLDRMKTMKTDDVIGSGGPARVTLTCSTTYYIDAQGSDSSSCTDSAPCLTLEHTLRMIQDTVDFAGHLVTVACADGPASYMGALNLAGSFVTGGGRLSIVGNTQAPERVFINADDSAAVGIVGDISIHLAGIKCAPPEPAWLSETTTVLGSTSTGVLSLQARLAPTRWRMAQGPPLSSTATN
jgi:hypothetical protein